MKNLFNLVFFLARRYVRIKKGEGFRSLITLFAGGGIGLGVATLLVVLSVMNGMQSDLKNKVLGGSSPLTIMRIGEEPISDWEAVVESVRGKVRGVKEASPYILEKALLKHNKRTDGALVRGVDPNSFSLVSDIPKNIKMGNFDLSGKKVILGNYLADRLWAQVGDTITISFPFSFTATPFGFIVPSGDYVLAGVFDMGMYEYNATLAIISLEEAKKLFGIDGVTGVDFTLENPYKAQEISIDIVGELGFPYRAISWMDRNRTLLRALEIEKKVMFIILILIIIVAAFNIISSLVLIVLGKMREIGILKALGASASLIRRIFLLAGLLVGGSGTIGGIIIAWILCFLLGKYKFIDLPSDVYFLTKLPVKMQIFDFVLVAFSAIILSLLAALYPAIKASNLDPVDAIRNE
ncbi:MAG: ABC transporter permease [candidate division WOR-3 bacterium]